VGWAAWQAVAVGALSGTVTFLFTDIESSTRLWQDDENAMRVAVGRHDELLREVVSGHGGEVFSTMGDGLAAAFPSASSAVAAALAAQDALAGEAWPTAAPLRVRMGLHTGEAELRDGDYFGTAVNRAARLMAVGHGGQIVCSQATADLARDSVEREVTIVDLGEHQLRDLVRPERVFQVCASGFVREFAPLRTGRATLGNLPRQVTTFVGREREMAELVDLVTARSLVTLTGVGGVGKTRLALEVAAAASDAFPQGAWLCELAPVTDPGAVWDAVATALRVVPSPGRRVDEMLVEYLAPRRALLVLDNCEHLLDAAAGMVRSFAAECTDVVVLATSREGLALAGEQIVAVPSLPLPAPGASGEARAEAASVRLFLDRARAVRHDFAPSTPTIEAIAQLCRRLDGIPLAIELAAARVTSLSPEDLLQRLDQRFKLLTRGGRAALERHQTLRSTIDWSYDLLDDSERVALRRLSVFAGGGDLDALEAVLGAAEGDERADVIDTVSRLVDKSLVVAEADATGRLRYRMLETVRQYAQERLEASDELLEVRAAHAGYYAGFAEVAGPHLHNADLPQWAPRVERENDNFRIVFDWALETGQAELALRVLAPLHGHGFATGYSATEWAGLAVEMPGAEDLPFFLTVASWAAFGATMRLDLPRATQIAAQIERVQGRQGRSDPTAFQGLGTLAFFSGDLVGAHRIAEEWVATARVAGDGYELSHALVLRAATEHFLNGPDARAHMEEAVRVSRETGTLSALAIGLGMLVPVLEPDTDGSDAERALAATDEAIAVATAIRDHIAVTVSAGTRATLLAALGEERGALVAASRCAEAMRLSNMPASFAPLAMGIAIVLTRRGEYCDAALLFGAADAMIFTYSGWMGRAFARVDDVLRLELGDEFEHLRARGADLSASESVDLLIDVTTRELDD
jgi:predicted ATPase/class 3 adenylate cyclase